MCFRSTSKGIKWLRNVEQRLNGVISRVTKYFGDRYVDTFSSSEGHDMCRPEATKWIEGYRGTVDAGSDWPAGRCGGWGGTAVGAELWSGGYRWGRLSV